MSRAVVHKINQRKTERERLMKSGESFDIIVIGGGTAGVVAAIQAARAGAKTLLVEKTARLGGTMTSGGVGFPGLFHARGGQIIAGIGWELVVRCVAEAGGRLPEFQANPRRHWENQIRIDRALYAALCDEAVIDSGADLTLHAMLARAEPSADGWRVELCAKEGLIAVAGKILIDCTGDANAVSIAGGKALKREECQPGTLVFELSGYDPDALDMKAIDEAFRREVERGGAAAADAGWNPDKPNVSRMLRSRGGSFNHITGVNAADSAGRARLEIEARRSMLRLWRFLRSQPGLERVKIDCVAPECGARETAVIAGRKTVTVHDYISGRRFDDALCHSYYPIDLHRADGEIDMRRVESDAAPTVPLGAMLPEGLENIIVAGRCVSSDRLANSALRVQATCMAMGQAAAAASVIALRRGVALEDAPLEEVRALLEEHGAIVP